MKVFKLFKLFKKERWMDFKDFAKRYNARAHLIDMTNDTKENTKNLINNNSDYFGMFKR